MDEQELGKNLWTLSYPKLKTLKYKKNYKIILNIQKNLITSHIQKHVQSPSNKSESGKRFKFL